MVDIDGDHDLDLWFSGSHVPTDARLSAWYENSGNMHQWHRHNVFKGPTLGANWGDVDGDGDPDLITGQDRNWAKTGNYAMVWMENPGNHTSTDAWQIHVIHPDPEDPDEVHTTYTNKNGSTSEKLDLNRDGRLDIVIAAFKTTLWYLPGPGNPQSSDGWTFYKIAESDEGHGGAAIADLDNDGDLDIAWGNAWYENPGDPLQTWESHSIDAGWATETQVDIADLDDDGYMDVVLTGEESAHGVAWYKNPRGKESEWKKNSVLEGWEGLHSLQLADFDRDGDQDILTAEMHTQGERRVAILENVNIEQNQWAIHMLSTKGSHKATTADLNGDGYPDVIGKNFEEDIRPRIWINPNGLQSN